MSGTEHERRPAVLGPWHEFLDRHRVGLDRTRLPVLLALDPGETTGWALFVQGDLEVCGQWLTPSPADLADFVAGINERHDDLEVLLYEEYRVRGNKIKEHIGSEVVTIQHIGAIKVIASELGLTLKKQTPGMAKGFVKDNKLKRWGLYQTNKRHANDAIRHGCYYILFAAGRKDPMHVEEEAEPNTGS